MYSMYSMWRDFNFMRFSKMGILMLIGSIFMSSIPKYLQLLPRAGKSFYFQKITGTLK